MKKANPNKLVLLLVFIFLMHPIYAQKLDWVKNIGSVSSEFGWALTLDKSGNVISGGSYADTIDFSNGLGTGFLASQGVNDGFVLKSDNNGNFVWAYSIGGIGDDEVYSVTTDDTGNVFVLGYFNNTVDFDAGAGVYNLSSNGASDIYILKLSVNGNFVWAKSIGSTSFDYGYGIALDTSSNIFITGEFRNTVDFDPDAGITNATSIAFADIFVLKLAADGSFDWVKTIGSTGMDQARAIAIDKNQNACVTGRFINTADFDPNAGIFNLTTSGFFEAFVLKLDNAGNFKWAAGFEGTNENDSYGITIDANDNIYTTGYFHQQTDFDPGTGIFILSTTPNLSDHDVFISKLDSAGNFVWAVNIGDSGAARGYSIAANDSDYIVITGVYDGVIDFDPGPDTSFADALGSPNAFVVKLNANGDYMWAGNAGVFNYSYSQAIACDASDNIYFAGYNFGSVDFDLGLKQYFSNTFGGNDFFVEKLKPCSAYVHPILVGGDLNLCPGDTLELIADPAIKYLWSTEENSQTIQITDSGFYYLTVRDSDYCIGTFPGVYVTQDTLPDNAGIISGLTTVSACANQLGIVYSVDTISNANFYTWTLPPLATIQNGIYTRQILVNYSAYSQSGNVSVVGSNSCGSSAAASLPVIFKPIPIAEICRASIDSATQKTLIEWQKPTETYVNGYVIYREISGTYTPIDTVPNAVFSSYLDTGSHPELQSEKYKIAVLDSCGNTGDISAPFTHQTIRLYGSIQLGGVAKLYWNDYVGITDSLRSFIVLRDTIGNAAFADTLAKNIVPNSIMNLTDINSALYPLCRYVIEMVFESNCTPSQRMLLSKSTSRSNIRNKTALFDSTSVGITSNDGVNFDFKIYPNPAKGFVNIELSENGDAYKINLTDVLGRKIATENFSATKQNKAQLQFPLSSIEPGIYFITIEHSNSPRRERKFIIE